MRTLRTSVFRRLPTLLTLQALLFAGCAAPGGGSRDVLRVGLTPDYPPMAMMETGDTGGRQKRIAGFEVDLAQTFVNQTGRDLELVDLPWNELIPSLLKGDIDVIMSGMSITDERRTRVAFSDPYLKTGLAMMFRAADISRYDSMQEVLQSRVRVGVKGGTIADVFATRNLHQAKIIRYQTTTDASADIIRNRLDLYIDDSPAIAWLISRHEAQLRGQQVPDTDTLLGWAVRRDRPDLLQELNDSLRTWKADGTIKKIAAFWIPPVSSGTP